MPAVRFSPPTDPRYTFVGSPYGPRPGRTTGRIDFHPGNDFNLDLDQPAAAEQGIRSAFDVPVHAVADGVVVYVGYDDPPPGTSPLWTRGYGNCVLIKHPGLGQSPVGGPWYTLYAHLRDMRVRVGSLTTAGVTIGRVGATMNNQFEAMGPHLHLEARVQLREPDAQTGSRDPIPGTNDPAYLDWQVGRSHFMQRRGHGYTIDPIWFLGLFGVNVLRQPTLIDGVQRRKGAILLGTTALGTGVMPETRLANYEPFPPPAGASYASRAPRGGGSSGTAGLLGLGAQPPDQMTLQIDQTTTTGGSSTTTTVTGSTEDLPYQPPIAGRLNNPLIPVVDPETQAPATPYAVAGVAAVGGLVALGIAFEVVRAVKGPRP